MISETRPDFLKLQPSIYSIKTDRVRNVWKQLTIFIMPKRRKPAYKPRKFSSKMASQRRSGKYWTFGWTKRIGKSYAFNRKTSRGFSFQRTTFSIFVHQRKCSGNSRMLVSGAGDRFCGYRFIIRKYQPFRKIDHFHSPFGLANTCLL